MGFKKQKQDKLENSEYTNNMENMDDFEFDSEETVEVSNVVPKDNKNKKNKVKKEKEPKQKKEKAPKEKTPKQKKEKAPKQKKEKPEKPVKEFTEEEIQRNNKLKLAGSIIGSLVGVITIITFGLYSNDYTSTILMEKLKSVEHEKMKDTYSGDTPTILTNFTDKTLNMNDFYNNTSVLYEIVSQAESLMVKTEDETGKHPNPNLVLNKINGVYYEDYVYNTSENEIVFEFRDYKDDINTTNLLKLYFNGSGTLTKAESNIPHYLTSKDTETITKLIRKFNGYYEGEYTNSFFNKDDINYYIYKNGESYYGVGVDEVTGVFREFFNVTNIDQIKQGLEGKYTYTGSIYNEVTSSNHTRYEYNTYEDIYKIARLNNFNQEDSESLKSLVNLMLGEQDIKIDVGNLYKISPNTTSKQGYKGYNVYIQNKNNLTGDSNYDLANIGINTSNKDVDLYGYIVSSNDNVIVHLTEYNQCEYNPLRTSLNQYITDSKEDLTLRARLALVHKMNGAALNSKMIVLPMMVEDEYYSDIMSSTVIAFVNPNGNTLYNKGLIIKPWDIYGQPIDIADITDSELSLAMGELVNTKGYINDIQEIIEEPKIIIETITVENIGVESEGTILFRHPTDSNKIIGMNSSELSEKLGAELVVGEQYVIEFIDKTENGNNILISNIQSATKIVKDTEINETTETTEEINQVETNE